ncbi:MAG: hypothetical protein MR902_09720 [Campylobacter sp.]|nr:hypothetical protein [Campylobacter sp.]
MSEKQDLNSAKNAPGTQLLESMIRGEQLVKKYGKIALIIMVVIVAWFGGGYAGSKIKERSINKANLVYNDLLKDPTNEKAKQTLKEKNLNLYAVYELGRAVDTNDTSNLQGLTSLEIDPLLKEIINIQIPNQSSSVMNEYKNLLKGFELLKQNKVDEARVEFAKIPTTSTLNQIVKNLLHYHGSAK